LVAILQEFLNQVLQLPQTIVVSQLSMCFLVTLRLLVARIRTQELIAQRTHVAMMLYCFQTYTWTVDNDGPTFTFCPQGANLGCNPTGVPAPGQAIATDNCVGDVTITSALGPIIEDGCNRTQVRTYTATDACGNANYCYQTFCMDF
jgi:hypothetical protein